MACVNGNVFLLPSVRCASHTLAYCYGYRHHLSSACKILHMETCGRCHNVTLREIAWHSAAPKAVHTTRTTYYCNRSGRYQVKGSGLRQLKIQATCKINCKCPAAMFVKISPTGVCVVIFFTVLLCSYSTMLLPTVAIMARMGEGLFQSYLNNLWKICVSWRLHTA